MGEGLESSALLSAHWLDALANEPNILHVFALLDLNTLVSEVLL